jgi:membrane-bound serine protease (ClpP class)
MRRVIRLLVACLSVVVAAPVAAQGSPPPIDVAQISGPLDSVAIDFLMDTIESSDAQVVVIQLDSPGAVSGSIEELLELVANPPLPVVIWVGPDPAVAQGGAAQLLLAAGLGTAAPGVKIGYLFPTVAGDSLPSAATPTGSDLLAALTDPYEVTEPDALVDLVVPSLGQLVTALDGMDLPYGDHSATLDTAETITDDAGNEVLVPTALVRFSEVGLWGKTLRLGIEPEAAFFFLVAGLTLAAFEFYAAGTGVMAVVAIASLFIAGYGLSELPLRWWAVAATLLGIALYAGDFQRSSLGWRSILGTTLLWSGGMWFTDGAPQISPLWWAVVLVVVGTALFFGIGMTAVVRARFGTTTIGREHLIGRIGTAVAPIAPVGPVLVDGAQWRAKATRASGIATGDAVEIVAVSGIELEVQPVEDP